MLDKNQRIIVESIKSAKRLKISMGGGKYEDDGTALVTLDIDMGDIRKVRHDIALAVQDYMMKTNRETWKKNISSNSASNIAGCARK